MPTWLKVLLVSVVLAIMVAAAAVFVGYRWFHANRARLVERGSELRHEGAMFGRGRDIQQCVGESLGRLQSSRTFANEMRSRLFLDGCLSTATAPPSFCESVPRQNEVAAAEWTINECRSLDAEEISRCSRVMQEVLRYCDQPERRRPPAPQTSK